MNTIIKKVLIFVLLAFAFTTTASAFSFPQNLKLGSRGEEVKNLQILLNQDKDTQVSESGAGSPGLETTYFGPATARAVIKFQNKYKADTLTPAGLTKGTGFVGALTRKKLSTMGTGVIAVISNTTPTLSTTNTCLTKYNPMTGKLCVPTTSTAIQTCLTKYDPMTGKLCVPTSATSATSAGSGNQSSTAVNTVSQTPAYSFSGGTGGGSGGATQTSTQTSTPASVNGGWSAYGSCSVTACGTTGNRYRTCTNPTPANGGAGCSGPSSETCSIPACGVSTFNITASAGSNGTISPVGGTTVSQGGTQKYTITPASGYQLATLTVGGGPVTPVTSYTFTNVQGNTTIYATFSVAPATTYTADFFHLAIVPNQTVNQTSFEIQVIAENINPATSPTAPVVVDGSGASHTMTPKTLKWPGTIENSITIWSATVPLVIDQVNNLTVVSGTKTIPFSIKHKTSLVIQTATNPTELVTKIKGALADSSVDVIQIDYNEADLGNIFHSIGNGIAKNRSTWLTIKPAQGKTVSWNRDSGTSMRRPNVSMVNLNGIIFGSDTSDSGGGQFYTEVNDRIWLSNMQFRAKYKYTWLKDTPMSITAQPDIRSLYTEGQKIYFTDSLWDGTATITAISNAELARDITFNSHRGDYNNFGKVFLNALAKDAVKVRNSANTDYLHNDGFQIWGNVGTNDLAFKGFRVISPNIGADIQPFKFDRAYTPNYSNILLDNILIEGANTTLNAYFEGVISNSRISNISFPNQVPMIRQDFTEPNGAFGATNVYISNLNVKKVFYGAPVGGTSITFDYNNVANASDISSELSAIPSLSGVIFSNIKVEQAPTEGTFSPYQTTAQNYRTNSYGGIFINTIGLAGLSSIDSTANLTHPGLFLNFTSTANRDVYLSDTRKIQLVVTVVNQGTGGAPGTQYVYTWTSPKVGTSGIWTSTSAILRAVNLETGSSPWPSVADLWGPYAKYSLKFLP